MYSLDHRDLMIRARELLDQTRAAVIAGVQIDGKPFVRWMSPLIIDEQPEVLYALTSPRFSKVANLDKNPQVEWMIQNASLTEIITLKGKVNILDNPSIRSQVIEKLAPRLIVFWKVNPDHSNCVVIETVLEEGTYFMPMKGACQTVSFKQEGHHG